VRSGTQDREGRALAWGLVAPVLLILIAFNVFPLLYNIVLSFTNAELVGDEARNVGTLNYARVFDDARFAAALRRTAAFVAGAVCCELLLGFSLALALRKPFRGKSVLVTALLIPMMLSPAVMGLYWTFFLNGNYGIVNQILGMFGMPQPQWVTDRDLKFLSILIIDIWMWTPFMLLISLAGLGAIPESLYEAAEIDRATTWKKFTRITLPMVAPVLGLGVLLRATDALKQFDLVMAVTGPNDDTTQTLSALLYQIVFRDGKVGVGAAFSCVILVAVIALATVFTRHLDKMRGAQG
jgi:multiple sugar transport system permease protein